MTVTLERHADYDQLIARAAEIVAGEISAAAGRSGKCRIVLSGGETPTALYVRLTAPPFLEAIPWARTAWFFGDERWVPPDDPRSNAGSVQRVLFSKAPVPSDQIFPVPTDLQNPRESARAYEATLRTHCPSDAWPAFDIVLMGLGADGHTASLFPGDDAVTERTAWVVATRAGRPVPDRITLTVPVFAHAGVMCFLVAGSAKADALAATLEGPVDPMRWPAQAVQPPSGRCIWLIDDAAGAKLRNRVTAAP